MHNTRYAVIFGCVLSLMLPAAGNSETSPVSASEAALSTILTTPSRYAAKVVYSYRERDVEEYDDRELSRSADTDGTAEIGRFFISGLLDLHPQLQVGLRLGLASVDLVDFSRESYDQSYGYGPAWGLTVRSLVGEFPDQGIRTEAYFEYDHASPDDWRRTFEGVEFVFSGEIEEWEIGVQILKSWMQYTFMGGLRYSDMSLDYEHDIARGNRQGGFEAVDHFGALLGARVALAQGWSGGVDAEFIDANGVSIFAEHRF